MSEMVERVARAMLVDELTRSPGNRRTFDDLWEEEKYVWLANARAAVEAMREPTTPQIDRFVSRALCVSVHGEGGWSEYAKTQWQTMIDAALQS